MLVIAKSATNISLLNFQNHRNKKIKGQLSENFVGGAGDFPQVRLRLNISKECIYWFSRPFPKKIDHDSYQVLIWKGCHDIITYWFVKIWRVSQIYDHMEPILTLSGLKGLNWPIRFWGSVWPTRKSRQWGQNRPGDDCSLIYDFLGRNTKGGQLTPPPPPKPARVESEFWKQNRLYMCLVSWDA